MHFTFKISIMLLVAAVNVEVYKVWFPINDNLRNIILVYSLMSDKVLGGDVNLSVSFKSSDKKEFTDKVKQKLPKSRYAILFYESVAGWENLVFEGNLKGKGMDFKKEDSIQGFGNIKTSSLILAYNISENDSTALFKRGNLYIRPCFPCVFYRNLNYYLEVVSDSPFIVVGAIFDGDKPVLRLPPKTFNSSSTVYSQVPIEDLKDGKYRLVLEVISPSLGEKINLEREFFVSPYGDDIASFIDYIASPKEKEEFEKIITLEGRLAFLKNFWEKRGWDYYLEFRKRVKYADSAFSTPALRGRYTDMGRIYIKRGKPDEITSVDMGIGDKPYIRWIYYSGGGYDYIFGDPVGTGEYVLIKTNDPGETRFSRPSSVPSLDINREARWEW